MESWQREFLLGSLENIRELTPITPEFIDLLRNAGGFSDEHLKHVVRNWLTLVLLSLLIL